MNVLDAYFLTENTEEHADIVDNVCSYSRETGSSYLFCSIDGILNSDNEFNIQQAKNYFSVVLNEHLKLLDILLDSGYALVEFSNPFLAMDFREMYFLNKDEVDILEKYVYCCVVDENGAIYYENIRTPKTEKPVKLTDVFTQEEIEQQILSAEMTEMQSLE